MKTDQLRVVVIPADPARPMEVRDIDHTLDQLQALVGGLIEPVDLRSIVGATVWVNEEFTFDENARGNFRASALAGCPLLGDAFVTADVDREGETMSVTEKQISDIYWVLGERRRVAQTSAPEVARG